MLDVCMLLLLYMYQGYIQIVGLTIGICLRDVHKTSVGRHVGLHPQTLSSSHEIFRQIIYKPLEQNIRLWFLLVHLSRRLKCTIVIMRCPSSVRPSVVVNFSHFRLLLWNRWMEFNKTWQEARSQRPLPSLCFSGRSEKQDGRLGLWLAETFSTSPLKPLNRIQWNLTGSKISTSSTKFVFFGPIGKTRWPPWPLIGWDIFGFSSETAKRNSTKLDRK